MFQSVELGQTLDKDSYEALLPELRTRLLKAQSALENAGFSVVVLLNGVGGMAEANNRLHEWLDARYLVSETYAEASEEERERPDFWRYWRWLPKAGRIGVFLGSWYTKPISDHARDLASEAEYERQLHRIVSFERTLTNDGVLLIKLWLHLSKEQLKERVKQLGKKSSTRFLISATERAELRHYKAFRRASLRAVRETDTAGAPWTLVEAADSRHRDVEVARHVLRALEARLAESSRRAAPESEAPIANPTTLLDTLDFGVRVEKSEYKEHMPELQARLNRLARRLGRRKRSAIIVFEGPDAAGKGGAIRRVIGGLDAQQYRVIPVSAPSDEERAHHYLWRFWRQLPRRGRITLFDRSWYGRVLVERVEGYATRPEWMRAYEEINDFERELTDDGIILIKFWLQITSDEQLRRFQERESEPWKQHKITAEDYRNRRREHLYEVAASEMIAKNGTDNAPFTVIAANDKRFTRLQVLRTLCQRLEEEV